MFSQIHNTPSTHPHQHTNTRKYLLPAKSIYQSEKLFIKKERERKK